MKTNKIRVPFRTAAAMTFRYAKRKVLEQLSAAAFIVIYLLLFQVVILRSPQLLSFSIAFGIAMVVMGLSFFSEGLSIGLMPLGETVGLELPQKSSLTQLMLFGLVIGFVSTLAEPAVQTLRTSGNAKAWEHPLLYMLLEVHTDALIAAVGTGVAAAVALSLFRYRAGISLAPFLYITVPILLILTLVFSFHDNLKSVIGLAWDTGAVTTGPVTVPLVIALGIGVSRTSAKDSGVSGGFGSIALASLYPVLAVMLLALGFSFFVPEPVDEQTFFSPDYRTEALKIFGSSEDLKAYAAAEGSSDWRDFFVLHEETSAEERSLQNDASAGSSDAYRQMTTIHILQEESLLALRAVIPLTAIIAAVLVLLLKKRPRYTDEFLLGIVFSFIGMVCLTTGIRMGLVPLGDTVGQQLPRVYQTEQVEKTFVIENFDSDLVRTAISITGEQRPYFTLYEKDGGIRIIPYNPDAYQEDTGMYIHRERTPLLFPKDLPILSIVFVLFFAFGLGYGSTLAEPALGALGKSIEEISVGTITKKGVVRAVSIGVGAGLVTGVIRIIYNLPMYWILIPAYLLLLLLTVFGSRDFIGIAWDSGGVTTGPVTVPLVLAMGLGIGQAVGRADGFGILALASVFPIISVQCYGVLISLRQKRVLEAIDEEAVYEQQ